MVYWMHATNKHVDSMINTLIAQCFTLNEKFHEHLVEKNGMSSMPISSLAFDKNHRSSWTKFKFGKYAIGTIVNI